MHNPIEQIKNNWENARTLKDGNANYCSLATVSVKGEVSIRTLVLRKITADSFVIYINASSPKWAQLEASTSFELLIFWPALMQQYRVRGEYSAIPDKIMEEHWSHKPYDSKILDHYYHHYQAQTSVLESRDSLLHGIQALKNTYPQASDIPFPENVKGVSIKANYIEAWGSSNTDAINTTQMGLHERTLYELSKGKWKQQVLVP
jgi:pyridoxine/pyridoxamine 5'-phosphate oxidase